MNSNLPERPTYTYTEADWTHLRAHFMGSILVDIHLHKLAQNIGAVWPAKGTDETPAKYLEYSFEGLAEAPTLAGQPMRLQLLLDILKETASFDDPFQDMIDSTPPAVRSASNSDALLTKLAIPPNFPLEFTALTSDTKELCQGEGAVTIGQCVALLQKMAQNVILGGEIRHLLNCLAHTDERALAAFLPLRAGARGLHLAEAIGIYIRNLPEAQRVACLVATPGTPETLKADDELVRRLAKLLEWFPEDAALLRETVMKKEAERYFRFLNDPALEQAAARLSQNYFSPAPAAPAAPAAQEKQTSGFLARLTGFFRSKR